jgi:hypothetical protein
MAHVSAFEPHRRARIMGWMSVGEDIGEIVAPILAGFVWNLNSATILLSVWIGLAVFTEVYALFVAAPGQRRQSTVDGRQPEARTDPR